MLGGAEIFVKGQGMTNMATSNFPRYLFTAMNNLAIDGDALNGKNFDFLEIITSLIYTGSSSLHHKSFFDLANILFFPYL